MSRLTACAVLLWSFAATASPQDPSMTAVSSGEAIVRRAPDIAYISVAVESRARTPRDAQSATAGIMTEVMKRLTDTGVARDAMRTIGLRVEPEFDFSNGKRTPRGFVARNAIEVRVDDVARTGELSDVAVQAGATSLQGVRFDLKDRSAIEREALRLAVGDARARAEAISAGAGKTIDRIVKIEEQRQPGASPGMMAFAVARGAETPVEIGLIDVHAAVTLTVSLK